MSPGDLVKIKPREWGYLPVYDPGPLTKVVGNLHQNSIALVVDHNLQTGTTTILLGNGAVGVVHDQYLTVVQSQGAKG